MESNALEFQIRPDDIQIKRPRLTFAGRFIKNLPWEEHEDLLKQRGINRWRVILEQNLLATDLGEALISKFELAADDPSISLSLSDCFATKSVPTILKRAACILSYLKWAKGVHSNPMAITEEVIYSYMCYLRNTGAAATYAKSFLSALRFAKFTIGLKGVTEALSPRVVGAASSMFRHKLPLHQANPLKVSQVYKLECLALGSRDLPTPIASGFFLFCLYACCRFKDCFLYTLDAAHQ